jgi:hypothetical protein
MNLHTFNPTKPTVFILSYLGIDYFKEWYTKIESLSDIQFVIVDNGQQIGTKEITDLPVYQTSQNIGCAGGWNLICNIAFNHLGLTKIIIGQDDAIVDGNIIKSLWNTSTDDVLVGAYDRSFEFAVFSITKHYWDTIGMFDENFIYGGCEDNDYKHRAKLNNKFITSLNYSADLNMSLSSKYLGEQLKSSNEYNANYIKRKWGEHYEYTHPFNDSSLRTDDYTIRDGLDSVYNNPAIFPSLTEYSTL